MPHQCVKCSTMYDDGADELLKGCPCKGKLFFYIRKEKFERSKRQLEDLKLTDDARIQMESDVREIVGDIETDVPVILDLEAIRIVKPGSYELDLVHLFNKAPIVVRLAEGKYMIDIAETFKRVKDGKKL
ncbi:MAG TPA: Zn-ribbon containing protein [Candidatus Nanoarchaeia archaeon]|nr:Zn-ribbon containing protein [Candidatus Nanoarchaeia archaeon]